MQEYYPEIIDIQEYTLSNVNYRNVISTTESFQLVCMSIKQGQEIGEEAHDVTQFFNIVQGRCTAVIEGNQETLREGQVLVVPASTRHNIVNSGDKVLKLYTIYTGIVHERGLIQYNKPLSD